MFQKNFYLYNIYLFSNEKKEIILINHKEISNNFMFYKDNISNINNSVNDLFFYSYYLKFNIIIIGGLYSIILYYQLNKKENIPINHLRNAYINKNTTTELTSDFLIIYERVYFYYIIFMLSLYYLVRQYILNKQETFLQKQIKLILLMGIVNCLVILYMKNNKYTNFLTNNFSKTLDGKLVIFSILYTNIMILLSEFIIYNNEKYQFKTKNYNKNVCLT